MMKNRKYNRSDDSRGFRKRKSNDYGKSEKFHAVCAKCGESCEVPFKPTQGKPVLCSNCFEKKQHDESGDYHKKNNRRSRGPKENFEDRDSLTYDAVCDNCGEECEVPFKPVKGKPVYCDNCFENKKVNEMEELKMEIAVLNAKMDKVLEILKTLFAVKKYKGEIKEEPDSPKKKMVVIKKEDEEEDEELGE